MIHILLIGGGGHCKSIIDSINSIKEISIYGIIDLPEKVGSSIYGVPVIGTEADLADIYKRGITHAFLTLGSIGNTDLRKDIVEMAKAIGFIFPTIIDSTAILSKYAVIKDGTYIAKGAIIGSSAIIEKHAIVNTGAIIEHDCIIGEFAHIAPGSTLSGSVKVGCHTHVGTNATIIQGVSIGNYSMIGAGSIVLKDIGNYCKAYGNPAKLISKRDEKGL